MARPFNYTLDKLLSEQPVLGQQWDKERNQELLVDGKYVRATAKYWWNCDNGHSWSSTLTNRLRGNGCPYCKGWLTWPGFNDLASKYPDIAAQWDHDQNGDLKPDMVTPCSNKRVWWICEKGHHWKATVNNRTRGYGCPYCASRKLLPGFNDLATRNPELAKLWDYSKNGDVTPEMIMPCANKKYWWICEKGHSWEREPSTKLSGVCPYCTGNSIMPGFNDFATLYPEVAAQWDYSKNGEVTPEMVSAGSRRKFWWICENGHSVESSISGRIKAGCTVCSGEKCMAGVNDLTSTHPELAKMWDYSKNGDVTPDMFLPHAHNKVWWICEKGHHWKATINSRTSNAHGCPYCSGLKVAEGETDLATIDPECAELWNYERNHGLLPSEVSPLSILRVWWKCKKGHQWMGSVKSVRKFGCPLCAGYHRRLTKYITY